MLGPDGEAHTVIGCGKYTKDIRDDEGFIDCFHCGMFWKPELEVSA
jgi:hypothetical protein